MSILAVAQICLVLKHVPLTWSLRKLFASTCCLALTAWNLQAQLVTKLEPETLAAFDSYTAKVKASLNDRWTGKRPFLGVEENATSLDRCLAGGLLIKQMGDGPSVQVPRGLIHDWVGSVYMPRITIDRVLNILENFDGHKDIYPEVVDSKTLSRNGHRVTGYWRLRQKGLVPVVLDVNQSVHYEQLGPGKWEGEADSQKIIENETGLFTKGRTYPPDEGHGYLWRMKSYWSLEERNGGVLAECRTLSLSRDIPPALAWAVGPYVQKVPENSLMSTLDQTRKAATTP